MEEHVKYKKVFINNLNKENCTLNEARIACKLIKNEILIVTTEELKKKIILCF